MSATLIRTPLNWRNLVAVYVLTFSFIWGLALGASGGDFRLAAFLSAVDRSAHLGLDVLGVQVMSADAYARGAVAKQELVSATTAVTAEPHAGFAPELKPYVSATAVPVPNAPYEPLQSE